MKKHTALHLLMLFSILIGISVLPCWAVETNAVETNSVKKNSYCIEPYPSKKSSSGLKITFINPGSSSDKTTGDFWMNVSQAMQSAADEFGMSLEIFYAERDHLLAQQQADTVFKRNDLPDFLVVVNEKMIAEPIIKKANAKGVRTLLILNALTDRQKITMGKPRERYPCWIGEIIPDNQKAGYLLAQQLTAQANKNNVPLKKLNMLALTGDYVTPASVDREKGLQDFLVKNPNVQLTHRYVGYWKSQQAQQIVTTILQKNVDIDLIWAANDAMALGAMAAIQQQSKKILVGGINWDAENLKKLASRELAVSVGGHFMVGGWAIVLLNDYATGQDFISESLSFKPAGFSVLTADNMVSRISHFPLYQIDRVNFLKLSQPAQRYQFEVEDLITAFDEKKK
jgi:ABC-type sugar transport system substrate-binding protein